MLFKRLSSTLTRRTWCFLFFLLSPHAQAQNTSEEWNLPIELNDYNTQIHFQVESSWNTIQGHAKEINGKISSDTPEELASIKGELSFPTLAIETGWSVRDSRLHKCMNAEKHPKVSISVKQKRNTCTLETIEKKPCYTTLIGQLRIVDVQKTIELEARIEKQKSHLLLSGKTSFSWADFNIKDPSIPLIAKVQPIVNISYVIRTPVSDHPGHQ